MSRYKCHKCESEHGTDNMVAYCAECYSREIEALRKERDEWKREAEVRSEGTVLNPWWLKCGELEKKLSAFTSARPDSPECVEAMRLGDLCRRFLAGEEGVWVGGGYVEKKGREALAVLALNLRALIVREGEARKEAQAVKETLAAIELSGKAGSYHEALAQRSHADRLESQVKEQSDLIIELGAKLNATKLREEGLEAELAELRDVSAGRLNALAEKHKEAVREWARAENAESELAALKAGTGEKEIERASRCTCECTSKDCPDVLYRAYRSALSRLADAEAREKAALSGIAERVNNEGDDSQACVSDIGYLVRKALAALNPAAPSEAKP